jgi:hypothetical protein
LFPPSRYLRPSSSAGSVARRGCWPN